MNTHLRIVLLQLVFLVSFAPLTTLPYSPTKREIEYQTVGLRLISLMLGCQSFICCIESKDSKSKVFYISAALALFSAGIWGTHPFEHQSSY